MSDEFNPDAYLQQTQVSSPSPEGFDPDSYLKENNDLSLGQQILGTVEKAASAATFGLSRGLESGISKGAELPSLSPEKQLEREENLPGALSFLGSAVGLLTPMGEFSAGKVLAEAGETAAKALKLGEQGASIWSKIGAGGTKGAIESALFQSGDELGRTFIDPQQSLETAATNIGLAGMIGAPIGGALGAVNPLWEAASGKKLGQFIEDFKGRVKEHLAHPNPVGILKDELETFYGSTKEMGHEVYGASGLKAKDIEKALPLQTSDEMVSQVTGLGDRLGASIKEMERDALEYPPRLVNQLKKEVQRFGNELEGAAEPKQYFDALNDLKRKFQATVDDSGLYDKLSPLRSIDENYSFVKKIDSFAKEAKSALEEDSVWGKAATRQKEINKAFSEFLPTLKDFESRFTTKIEGQRVLDPAKLNTYINQLGKPNAEIKQEMMQNFIEASEKYRSVVDKTHANLGIENPYQPNTLTFSKSTVQKLTPGAKAADALVKKGLANLAGKTVGGGMGGLAGSAVGHPILGALLGEHTLGHFFTSILPSLTKPLLEGANSSGGLKAAVDLGMRVIKGESLINKASKNLFRSGEMVLPSHLIPSDKDRSKLNKQLESYRKTPDQFTQMGGKIGDYLPAHASNLGQFAGNAINYLDSLRPSEDKKNPLDSEVVVSKMEEHQYNEALDIAEQPLIVLNKVKEGTLTTQDLMHLKSIYPNLYPKLVQKVTSEMIEHLNRGEDIPYKTRMGLSLFVGQPLDSTMTPEAIQSTQMSMMPTQEAQPKHSMAALNKMGKNESTPAQDRELYRSSKA